MNPSVIAEDYTKNFHTFIIDFSKKYEILYARSLGKGILKTLSPAIEHNYKTKTKATKNEDQDYKEERCKDGRREEALRQARCSTTAKKMAYKAKSGIYSATVQLAPGEYQYKFVIDGTWCADPENENSVKNDQGTFNSVVVVK